MILPCVTSALESFYFKVEKHIYRKKGGFTKEMDTRKGVCTAIRHKNGKEVMVLIKSPDRNMPLSSKLFYFLGRDSNGNKLEVPPEAVRIKKTSWMND